MPPKAAGKAPAGKAPATKKTVASKKKATPKKIAPAGGPARKKKRVENWSSYIYKVLKQVHPDTGISKTAMSILNSFCNDMFERFGKEVADLVKISKKSTINAREISAAAKLLLPGQLYEHAEKEAHKAMAALNGAQTTRSRATKTRAGG